MAALRGDTKRVAPPAPPPSVPTPLEAEIETLLHDLRACQQHLLEAVREHRAAISSADETAIQIGLEKHRAATDELRILEERRARLGARVVGRGAPAGARPTMGELLGRVPAAARARLAELAAAVRDIAITVQREQRALGDAALLLSGHMEGLMRGVAAKVSEAGVYGRRGYVERPGRPVGTLDVSR